jgi:integrase
MIGTSIDRLPFLPRNDHIPDYFSEDDIVRIFAACPQPQASCYAATLLYGCRRASELCNLDGCDLDLKSVHFIHEGKGGKDGEEQTLW